MALDILKTHYLLMAVQEMTPVSTFLRDRYAPTNPSTDIFATNDVLVEYKDGSKRLAPFVAPRKGGITILREGYTMERYEPPYIAPRRTLTIDDLAKRGFGEALYTDLTPADREAVMIMNDIAEMDEMITRREEAMVAETMLKNSCTMRHYADDMKTVYDEKQIMFYEGSSNPATYTPTTKWGQTGAKILDDIYTMAMKLISRGLPATDLVVAPDVAQIMLNDATIKELMDIRNYNIGSMAPVALPNGVSRLCVLNVYGIEITVFVYADTYLADDDTQTQFIPAGNVVLTAPACARTLYGAVTQLEQTDGRFHTYAGKRVPKYLADAVSNVRTITTTSCPLVVPNNKNPWVSAKVTQ